MELNHRIKLLSDILLDPNASVAEKDDAAILMGEIGEEKGLQGLLNAIRHNAIRDEGVLITCGESIGEIWVRQDTFQINFYKTLPPKTRAGVCHVIKSDKPDWYKLYNLEIEKF